MTTPIRHVIVAGILASVVTACTSGDEPGVTTVPATDGSTTGRPPTGTTTLPPTGDLGTEENPIPILVVAAPGDETAEGGDTLASALEARTGYAFEVEVVDSYGAVLEELCAEPGGMSLLPAQAYVVGSDLCGVRVALKAVQSGYSAYWALFLVARNSKIETIEDLTGKSWAHPGPGSASGWLVPAGMLASADTEPGEVSDVGSHRKVVLAVYRGDAQFGTTFYLPPIDAEGNDLWDGTVENADVPDDLLPSCEGTPDGDLFCGTNYEVRDARRTIAAENPDVVQKVRILTVSEPIPSDTISFSPEFPSEIEDAVVETLMDIATNRPNAFAKAFAAWSWTGVAETNDAEFESMRELVSALGLTTEDLG